MKAFRTHWRQTYISSRSSSTEVYARNLLRAFVSKLGEVFHIQARQGEKPWVGYGWVGVGEASDGVKYTFVKEATDLLEDRRCYRRELFGVDNGARALKQSLFSLSRVKFHLEP